MASQSPYYGLKTLNDAFAQDEAFGREIAVNFRRLMAANATREEIQRYARTIGYAPVIDYGNGRVKDTTEFLAQNAPPSFGETTQDVVLGLPRGAAEGLLSAADAGAGLWRLAGSDAPMRAVGKIREGVHTFLPMSNEYRAAKQAEGVFDFNPAKVSQGVGQIASMYGPGGAVKGAAALGSKGAAKFMVREAARQAAGKTSLAVKTGIAMGTGSAARQAYEEGATPGQSVLPMIAGAAGGYLEKFGTERVISKMLSPGTEMVKDASGRFVFPKASTLPGFLKTAGTGVVAETLEEQAASALLEVGRTTYAKDPFLDRLVQGQVDTLAVAPYTILPFSLYSGARASNFKQQLSAAERIVRERKPSVFSPDGFDGSSLEREYVDLSAVSADDVRNLVESAAEIERAETSRGGTTVAPVFSVTSASHEPMQALAEQLANATGARVVFFGQTPESREARKAAGVKEPVAPSVLGKYDDSTNTIYVNSDATPEAQMVFGAMHEVTHMLRKADPAGIDGVFDRISAAFGAEFADYSKAVADAYKGAPAEVVTEEGYVNFMTQHLFGYMMAAITDEQSMRNMLLADPSLGQVIAAPFFEIAENLALRKGSPSYDRQAADRLANAALRFAQSAGVGAEDATVQYSPEATDVARNMSYASDFVEALQSFLGDKGERMESVRRVVAALKTENEAISQVDLMAGAAGRTGMTIPEVEAMYSELQAAESMYPATAAVVKSRNEAIAKARAEAKPDATPEEIAAAEAEAAAAAEAEAKSAAEAGRQRTLVVEAIAVANEVGGVLGVDPLRLLRARKKDLGSLKGLSDAQKAALEVARNAWSESEPQYREGEELAAAEKTAGEIKAFDRTKLEEQIRLKNRTPLQTLEEERQRTEKEKAEREEARKAKEKAKPAKPAKAKAKPAAQEATVDPAAVPDVRPAEAAPAEPTASTPATQEDLTKAAALRSQASFSEELAGKPALELQNFVESFPAELAELVGKPYLEQVAILRAEAKRLTDEARAIDGKFARYVAFGAPRSTYAPTPDAEAIKRQMDVINSDFDSPVSRSERDPIPVAKGDSGPKAIAKFFRRLMPAADVLDYASVMPKKADGGVNTAMADWSSRPVQRMVDRMSARIYDVSRAALHEYPSMIGWYKDRVEMAMRIAEEMDPDIAKPEHAFRFKVALAVMSNGERVNANTAHAWYIYQAWKVKPDAGLLTAFRNSMAKAKRQNSMEAHLAAVDMMVEKIGWAGVQQFMARTGTRERLIEDMVAEFGVSRSTASDMTTGELLDEVVPYSLFLGPKLGSFYGNLDGRYETTTMDLWFMRTMGRIFGTQLRSVESDQLSARLQQAESAVDPQVLADVRRKAEVREGASLQTRAIAYSKLFMDAAERAAFESKSGATEQNNEFRLAANIMAKAVDGKQLVEAPENGAHRRMIRMAMGKVVDRLKAEDGIDISPAELQAVLWYYEKEVHEEYGSGTRDAPDYATAMKLLWDEIRKPKLDDFIAIQQGQKAAYRRTKQRAEAQAQRVVGVGQQVREEKAESDRIASLAAALSSPKAYRGGRIESRRSIGRFGDPAAVDARIQREASQTFDEKYRSSPEQKPAGEVQSFDYFARRVPISDRVSAQVADKLEDTITKIKIAGRPSQPLLATYDAVTEIMARYGGGVAERLGQAIANLHRFELVGQQVTNHLDLAALAQIYRDPRFEHGRMFFVDDAGNIVAQTSLSVEDPARTYLIMAPQDYYLDAVSDAAMKLGATGVYLMHNHPNSNIYPSNADSRATASLIGQFRVRNLKTLGHIILDTDQYAFIDPARMEDLSNAVGVDPAMFASYASMDDLIREGAVSFHQIPTQSADLDEAYKTTEDVELLEGRKLRSLAFESFPGAMRRYAVPPNREFDAQGNLKKLNAKQRAAQKMSQDVKDSIRKLTASTGTLLKIGRAAAHAIEGSQQVVLIALDGANHRVTSISGVATVDLLAMDEKELQSFLKRNMSIANGTSLVAVGSGSDFKTAAALDRLYSYCVDCVMSTGRTNANGYPEVVSYNVKNIWSGSGSDSLGQESPQGLLSLIAGQNPLTGAEIPFQRGEDVSPRLYAATRAVAKSQDPVTNQVVIDSRNSGFNLITLSPERMFSKLPAASGRMGQFITFFPLMPDVQLLTELEALTGFDSMMNPRFSGSGSPGVMQALAQSAVDAYNSKTDRGPGYFAKRVAAPGTGMMDARMALDQGRGVEHFAKRVRIGGRSIRAVTDQENAAYRMYHEEGMHRAARKLKANVAAKLGLHHAWHGTSAPVRFLAFNPKELGSKTQAASAKEAFFAVAHREVAEGYGAMGGVVAGPTAGELDNLSQQYAEMGLALDEMAGSDLQIVPLRPVDATEGGDREAFLGRWKNSYGGSPSLKFVILGLAPEEKDGVYISHTLGDVVGVPYLSLHDHDNISDEAFASFMAKSMEADPAVWSGRVLNLGTASSLDEARAKTRKVIDALYSKSEELQSLALEADAGFDPLNEPEEVEPNVLELWIKMSNPMVVDGRGRFFRDNRFYKTVLRAKQRGHDGVVFANVDDGAVRTGKTSTVYAFFRPQQAKFASVFEVDDAGNLIDLDKQFDFRKSDMRFAKRVPFFSSGMDAAKPLDFSAMDHPSAGWFVKHFTDYVQPIRTAVKAVEAAAKESGGSMAAWSERYDVSARLDLYRNLAAQYAKTGEAFVDDTAKAMAEGSIPLTREDGDEAGNDNVSVEEYLIAKHAQRRNEVLLDDTLRADAAYRKAMDAKDAKTMAARRAALIAADPTIASLSGMSNAEASSLLAKAKHPAYSKLSQATQALQARKLQLGVQAGLLSAAEAQAWKDKFGPDYVPLKTTLLDPNEGYLGGSGFAVRGMESRKATGRRTIADDVAGHMLVDYGAFVSRATKNWVGQSFFKLAQEYPNPAWTLYPDRDSIPIHDQNRIFTAKFNGEERFMVVNNAEMVRALKNMDMADMGRGMAVASMLSRMFTKLQTAWSPAFIVPNFARDLGLALTLTGVDEGLDAAKRVAGNIPEAIKTIFSEQFGRPPGKLDTYYREMQQVGAVTGYATYWDVQDAAAQLKLQAARLGNQTSMPVEFVRGLGDLMEKLNAVAERATRLAVYAEARERGLSRLKSGEVAVNITVNFGRRGNATPVMNTLYPFFNASIQGTDNLARRMYWSERATDKQKKRMAAAIGSMSLMGYLFSMIARAAGGEDDDGEVAYRNIPEYDLSRNIVVMVPDGKGDRFLVPLPWGLSAAYYMGVQMERMQSGDETPMDSGGRVLRNTIENISPINGATWSQAIAPTLVDPIVQIAENTNFAGAKIMPDRNPYDKTPLPDSQLKFKTVNPVASWAAETMNELTGGTRRKAGAIDVSPESIEHLAKFMAGGAGNFVYGVFNGIAKPLAGEEITFEQVPAVGAVAGRFYTEEDQDRRTTTEFYDNIQKFAVLREDLEDPTTAREARRSRLRTLDAYTTQVDTKVRDLRKKALAARTEAERERLQNQMVTMMRQYNRRYNQLAQGGTRN